MALVVVFVSRGGDDDVSSDGPSATTSPGPLPSACATEQPSEPALPLLGVAGESPGRAALAVKIDNTTSGRPPVGLAQADVVFEELVEGGLTRLLAVYHSDDPATVGPVRSARSTDLSILSELGLPLFAWSGANAIFREEIENADLVDLVDVGAAAAPDAYRRDEDRPAPYNLFADPESLRSAGAEGEAESESDSSGCNPPALFDYRAPGEALAGTGVTTATGYRSDAAASGLATDIAWDWEADEGVWARTQDGTSHVDDDGTRIAVANVVIRSTPYRDSGLRDAVGSVVPEAEVVGEGDALLLSDGHAQTARWHKPSADAPTTYTGLDGSPLRLTSGQTWVEVLPPDAGEVVR